MAVSDQWSDLTTRLVSAAAMVVVGLICILIGGHVFHALVALICGLMVWELVGMLRPGVRHAQIQLGVVAGLAVMLAIYLPFGLALLLLLAPIMFGFVQFEDNRVLFVSFTAMILLAGFGMMQVRDDMGVGWLMWLVLVVIVTDVFGYFAGRFFGGPKFWPAISPKKTWSGTVAGWIGAALVGLMFSINVEGGVLLMVISIAVSMASQMGDIAESALKRKMGVKDSSDLIPGHGGLMDRFDGMLGASLFLLIIGLLIGFPPGLG